MPPSGLPDLNVPQPAQGLPSEIPGQQVASNNNPFDSQEPQAKQNAPIDVGNKNPFDEESQPAKSPASDNPFDSTSLPGPVDLPGDKNSFASKMPLKDVAAAHLLPTQQEQVKILNNINKSYNAAVENGKVMVNVEGQRLPMDQENADLLHGMAQNSGNALLFSAMGLGQMVLDGTAAMTIKYGSGLTKLPGVVLKIASAPLSGFGGTYISRYLQELWTKTPPDPIQVRKDAVVAGTLATMATAASAVISAPVSSGASKLAENKLQNSVSNLIDAMGATEKAKSFSQIGKEIINPDNIVYNGQKNKSGFIDDLADSFSSRFEQFDSKVMAQLPDAKVSKEALPLMQKIKDLINERAPGAVTWSKQGIPIIKDRDAISFSDPDGAITTSVSNPSRDAFGTIDGQRALKSLVDDYHTLYNNTSNGGVPYSVFSNIVKRWGEQSKFVPGVAESYSGKAVTSTFREIRRAGAEAKMEFITNNLPTEDAEAAKRLYADYSSSSKPIDHLLDLFNSSNQSAEVFAKALIRPQNSKELSGLAYLTEGANKPGTNSVIDNLRQAHLYEGLKQNLSPSGVLNKRGLLNYIDSIGADNKAILYGSKYEEARMKSYISSLEKLSYSKNPSEFDVSQTALAMSYISPKKTMSSSIFGDMAQKNPEVWGRVAKRLEEMSSLPKYNGDMATGMGAAARFLNDRITASAFRAGSSVWQTASPNSWSRQLLENPIKSFMDKRSFLGQKNRSEP